MRYVSILVLALLLCGSAFALPPVTEGVDATALVMAEPVASATLAVPVTEAEVGTVFTQLLDAVNNGHWAIFGGMFLLLLVWGMNRMGLAAKIGSIYVPWVALGTGAVAAIAVGLAQGAPMLDSLKLGLLEGGVAIALWELAAKHFMGSKTPAASAAPTAEAAPPPA